jgi:hypothetical protein
VARVDPVPKIIVIFEVPRVENLFKNSGSSITFFAFKGQHPWSKGRTRLKITVIFEVPRVENLYK